MKQEIYQKAASSITYTCTMSWPGYALGKSFLLYFICTVCKIHIKNIVKFQSHNLKFQLGMSSLDLHKVHQTNTFFRHTTVKFHLMRAKNRPYMYKSDSVDQALYFERKYVHITNTSLADIKC